MIVPPNDSADLTTEPKAQPATEPELATQQLVEEAAVGRILSLSFLCSLISLQPPPSYYPSEQHATASTCNTQPTFKSKPTNHLYLFSEHSSVKGEYAIDPSMKIPPSLLPPLSPEESEADRKHLCVHSTNGSVNAEIWLLSQDAKPFDSKTPTKRTILDLGSEHGSVTARVVCPSFDRS
jgi:hypothetical protein